MQAEELVALASAHGVDLAKVATHSVPRGPRLTRRHGTNGHAYEELLEPSAQRANGKASHTWARQPWTIAELGQVATGVPDISFKAACYAFAGDRSVYWHLWTQLQHAAQQMRVRYSWPAQVRNLEGTSHFYLEQLAALVLDEDANRHLFTSAPALYWIVAGVDEATWSRAVSERFDALQRRYLGWIGEAMSIMQPRLEELAAEEGGSHARRRCWHVRRRRRPIEWPGRNLRRMLEPPA
jgi:hypothetical protein